MLSYKHSSENDINSFTFCSVVVIGWVACETWTASETMNRNGQRLTIIQALNRHRLRIIFCPCTHIEPYCLSLHNCSCYNLAPHNSLLGITTVVIIITSIEACLWRVSLLQHILALTALQWRFWKCALALLWKLFLTESSFFFFDIWRPRNALESPDTPLNFGNMQLKHASTVS